MSDRIGNSRTPPTRDDPRSEVLSRAYRDAVEAASVEPTGSLDEAIRAAAHDAVKARSGHIDAAGFREVLRRWRTPLTLAATVLLAMGIALRVHRASETEMMAPRVPTMNQSDQNGAVANYDARKPLGRIHENRMAKQQAGGTADSTEAAPSSAKAPARKEEITKEPGITPSEGAPSHGFADKPQDNENPKAGGAESAPPQLNEGKTRSGANPFAGNFGRTPVPSQGTDSGVAPGAPVPAQRERRSASNPSLHGQIQRMEQQKEALTSPAAVQSIAQRLDGWPVEEWVEEIRNLKRAGREADASELLAALRKKFPDFSLPEDLK